MTVSATSIANLALQALGETNAIINIEDATKRSQQCKRAYDSERPALIRAHPWSFARSRTVLAPDTAAPAFGYAYQYELPVNCLRVYGSPDLTDDDFEIEGGKLLTDTGPALKIWFGRNVTDTNQFDPLFVLALGLKMAENLCEVVTGSTNKLSEVGGRYKTAIAEAKRANAIERPARHFQEDSWLEARL